MNSCSKCGAERPFTKTKSILCLSCRRVADKAWRERRKASGQPVVTPKMPREYHVAYDATYSKRPDVKRKRAAQMRQYARDPELRPRHQARWLVRRALEAGRLERCGCEVCGTPKTHAHHDDYSRPLDVRWLCPTHHRDHHNKAEGR